MGLEMITIFYCISNLSDSCNHTLITMNFIFQNVFILFWCGSRQSSGNLDDDWLESQVANSSYMMKNNKNVHMKAL
jgi:hypothetical protein